jgi:hypothetical protein
MTELCAPMSLAGPGDRDVGLVDGPVSQQKATCGAGDGEDTARPIAGTASHLPDSTVRADPAILPRPATADALINSGQDQAAAPPASGELV